MTNKEFIDLSSELTRYNYKISNADRKVFMKALREVPGALEQAQALFGDRGVYYATSKDLGQFVKDVNRGRVVAEKTQKGFKGIINKKDYSIDYRARKDVYEVKQTRQFKKNSK